MYLPGSKTVTQINFYIYDNAPGFACLTVFRTTPIDMTEDEMGQVCTSGAQTGLQVLEITDLNATRISPSNGMYLWVFLTEKSAELQFYGVKVFYEN